ncbi:Polyketide synthase [Frankliniella fusca]|uniref:Polyketide synthase n=1 Tax=Frankliniella fusca TaxID=407009 RepID=A0AAE1H0J3_9NEOP|nr:Polyketide synthase [Frankliniella fusca]
MVYSAYATIPSYMYSIHQVLFCIVGMSLFLPALFVPWICIAAGCLCLVLDLFFKETASALSHYVKLALPFWLLPTSLFLLIVHWPLSKDDKISIP